MLACLQDIKIWILSWTNLEAALFIGTFLILALICFKIAIKTHYNAKKIVFKFGIIFLTILFFALAILLASVYIVK